jgi:hypothetical protein
MCVNPTFAAFVNLNTLADQSDAIHLVDGCLDERTLRPLPTYVLAALPLTADEQQHSAVFVLSGDLHDEVTPTAQCVSRLAVCRPLPMDEWGRLETGNEIIYTEAYQFSEQERPHISQFPALCSHVGTVRVSDDKRELLYAVSWVGNHNDQLSLEYSEVYELWQVQRFIALAYAK